MSVLRNSEMWQLSFFLILKVMRVGRGPMGTIPRMYLLRYLKRILKSDSFIQYVRYPSLKIYL